MPLNERNAHPPLRRTFAGILETITLLHREDDHNQHTITAHKLFRCRKSKYTKRGQHIQGEMSSDHRQTWHIPRSELTRVGIDHINALDIVVDKRNRHWQPESTTNINVKLFETEIDLDCLRVDPPLVPPPIGDLGSPEQY